MKFSPAFLFFSSSVLVLIGTTIGAGIFGLPFLFSRIGLGWAVTLFFFLALVMIFEQLGYVFVTLHTEGKHRLPGYAKIHLGQWARNVEIVSTIAGYIGGLLVYGILAGTFLNIIIPALEPFWGSIAFFIVGVFLIGLRQNIFVRVESWLTILLILLFLGIVIVGFNSVRLDSLSVVMSQGSAWWHFLLLAYGAILFSLTAIAAIPEVSAVFFTMRTTRLRDHAVYWSVGAGTVLAALFTLLFALVVVGISGGSTTPDALSGLSIFLGKGVIVAGAWVGILAVVTSFLTFGIYARHTLNYDFGLSRVAASAIVSLVPPALFLIGLRNFIDVIGLLGAVFGGIDSILIACMVGRIRYKLHHKFSAVEVALWVAGAVFLTGIVLELYFFAQNIFR